MKMNEPRRHKLVRQIPWLSAKLYTGLLHTKQRVFDTSEFSAEKPKIWLRRKIAYRKILHIITIIIIIIVTSAESSKPLLMVRVDGHLPERESKLGCTGKKWLSVQKPVMRDKDVPPIIRAQDLPVDVSDHFAPSECTNSNQESSRLPHSNTQSH